MGLKNFLQLPKEIYFLLRKIKYLVRAQGRETTHFQLFFGICSYSFKPKLVRTHASSRTNVATTGKSLEFPLCHETSK